MRLGSCLAGAVPAILGLAALATLSGCSTLGYLLQAGKGQMALLNHARPIPEVLRDERTPPKVKKLLAEIPSIKKFGEEFGLKATKNYTDYVKLDRSAASYVVSACAPLEFKSREWSFPIVGSFTYLGWFDLDGAKAYAEELRKTGADVDLRGARAYSTLGWFKDAVLSTMISDGEEALGDLVNVVIHESVHVTYYLSGQSYFNESIASFVAEKLTPDYLTRTRGQGSPEFVAYEKSEAEGDRREQILYKGYQELKALYASGVPDEKKLEEKKRILADIREKAGIKREINNASLIQFRTYGVGRPEYEALFRACNHEWPRFWQAIRKVNEKSFSKTHQEDLAPVLLPLARDGCGGA